MSLVYQLPKDTDRYVALMSECVKYITQNQSIGLNGIIAIGAFEIGMEYLILQIAETFHLKIWMSERRRQFLDEMMSNGVQADAVDSNGTEIYSFDRVISELRDKIVINPRKANIHVLDVENIHPNVSN